MSLIAKGRIPGYSLKIRAMPVQFSGVWSFILILVSAGAFIMGLAAFVRLAAFLPMQISFLNAWEATSIHLMVGCALAVAIVWLIGFRPPVPDHLSSAHDQALAERNARLLEEVAALRQEVAQARHLAYHDALTGLPNRALLLDRLNQAMLQATRQDHTVGLLLLDIDDFKSVNDQLGHNVGDAVLQSVAIRLSGSIRGCDTACRYGGDEFVILLPEIGGVEEMKAVAAKIRCCLVPPHRIGNEIVRVCVSIGTALLREGQANSRELIDAADSAMYQAKATTRTGSGERA